MKIVNAGHVQAIFDLYEKLLSTPDWEFAEWDKLRKKMANAKEHMDKHSVKVNCTMKELELSIEPVRKIVSIFDDYIEGSRDMTEDDYHNELSDEANDLHVVHVNNIPRDEF